MSGIQGGTAGGRAAALCWRSPRLAMRQPNPHLGGTQRQSGEGVLVHLWGSRRAAGLATSVCTVH